ncbi:MAG: hypothetical protein ACLFO1_09945 [Spirochaetaceae bacterium]
MEVTEDTLKTIGSYVKGNLAERRQEMLARFAQMDRRYEEMRKDFHDVGRPSDNIDRLSRQNNFAFYLLLIQIALFAAVYTYATFIH